MKLNWTSDNVRLPERPLDPPVVRRYRVHGYCMVPHECAMEIEASNPHEALLKAMASNWRYYIDHGDDRAATDWQPTVEEI